jgi:hypothetical protein
MPRLCGTPRSRAIGKVPQIVVGSDARCDGTALDPRSERKVHECTLVAASPEVSATTLSPNHFYGSTSPEKRRNNFATIVRC